MQLDRLATPATTEVADRVPLALWPSPLSAVVAGSALASVLQPEQAGHWPLLRGKAD